MPVTFNVAPHPAEKVGGAFRPIKSVDELLECTWGEYATTTRSKELLQSSFVNVDFMHIEHSRNGFVNTVIDAYNEHHHLVLRCVHPGYVPFLATQI